MKKEKITDPVKLLGECVDVYLKDGGQFVFKVTECGPNHIGGYDDERMNLHIELVDIDFIIRH